MTESNEGMPPTAFAAMLQTAWRGRHQRQRRSALDRAVAIDDLRTLARRRLPRGVWDYLEGAAEDEKTARRNQDGFGDLSLVPSQLTDVDKIELTTTLAGTPVAAPIVCAPTGYSRLFHTDGEAAVAEAAASAGLIYTLSTMSTCSIEDAATASGAGPRWFQLYVWRDRTLVEELLGRAHAAGYTGLCLTVDTAILGRRERDIRNGFTIPPAPTLRSVIEGAAHPQWWWQFLRSEPLVFSNVMSRIEGDADPIGGGFVARQFDATVTWDDAAWMAEKWAGTFAVKGVLSAADAVRAIDVGASVIVVSNHGGRQLDHAAAPIDVLPEIVAAVGDRAEVILDGGVRRGTDVVKALALGARACMVGRPYLYGLAAGGRDGVARALKMLTTELRTSLALLGCRSVHDLNPSYVRRVGGSAR